MAKARAPKKPISSSMLESYVEACPHYTTNLDEMRTLFVVLVGYAGFLRIGFSVSKYVISQLKQNILKFFLPQRKTTSSGKGSMFISLGPAKNLSSSHY